jgi:hypothetical protein
MKSDTDFANPYEKELDAQESKIKELEKKLHEANMRSAPELEKKLVEAQERIDSESAFHKEAGRLLTIEQKKLKITTKALNKIYDDDRSMEDMERTANRALSEVEDCEETEMVKE